MPSRRAARHAPLQCELRAPIEAAKPLARCGPRGRGGGRGAEARGCCLR